MMRDKITIPAALFALLVDKASVTPSELASAVEKYKTLAKVPRLHIHGVRWFDGNNTQHKVYVYLNDTTVATLTGQGANEQYLWTAFDWLVENQPEAVPGWDKRLHHPTIYLRETIQGTYSDADVTRKKDM